MSRPICSPLDPNCWRYQSLNRQCPVTGEEECKCKYEMITPLPSTLKDTLRKLFSDHAVWTYLYIITEVLKTPNLSSVTERLLQNQKDIGMAVASIYGQTVGHELTRLLTDHILLASAVVKMAINVHNRAASQTDLNHKLDQLFVNSGETSRAIASLNPSELPYDVVVTHFDEHNQYVVNLATMYINGQYQEAIKEYDCYYNHMLVLSDLITYGVEKALLNP